MSHTTPQVEVATDVGSTLRRAREAKDITIASAAMQTNLRSDVIEKLEHNAFSEVGAPVFVRGYLYIYARFLGVDESIIEQSITDEQTATVRDRSLRLNSANIESQTNPYRRSMLRGWVSLFLVVLVGGILLVQFLKDDSWLMQQIRGTFTQQASSADNVQGVEENAADIAPPDFTVEVDSNEAESQQLPKLTSIDDIGSDASSDTLSDDNSASGLSLTSLDDVGVSDDLSAPNRDTAEAKSVAIQAEPDTAILTTQRENWIEVRDKNGKILHSKIYKAGSNIELDAQSGPYRLNIGRPDAVTLTINGQKKALADYRMKNQTRRFQLSLSNDES